jgi:transcriptional regulator with XRE-family HTH domain
MSDLYTYIGQKIRELRENYGAKGASQDEVAKAVGTTANTVSRWESATYKPSVKDLYKLSRFFGVSIAVFIPEIPEMEDTKLQALMSATGDLRPEELEELIEYARFRKARRELKNARKRKK